MTWLPLFKCVRGLFKFVWQILSFAIYSIWIKLPLLGRIYIFIAGLCTNYWTGFIETCGKVDYSTALFSLFRSLLEAECSHWVSAAAVLTPMWPSAENSYPLRCLTCFRCIWRRMCLFWSLPQRHENRETSLKDEAALGGTLTQQVGVTWFMSGRGFCTSFSFSLAKSCSIRFSCSW